MATVAHRQCRQAVRQTLDTQTDALRAAGIAKIFAEKISARARVKPELDKAVALAREMRSSGIAVTIVVHEHDRGVVSVPAGPDVLPRSAIRGRIGGLRAAIPWLGSRRRSAASWRG